MGRKRLPEDEKLERITIRLPKKEIERLREMKVNVSKYVRTLIKLNKPL